MPFRNYLFSTKDLPTEAKLNPSTYVKNRDDQAIIGRYLLLASLVLKL